MRKLDTRMAQNTIFDAIISGTYKLYSSMQDKQTFSIRGKLVSGKGVGARNPPLSNFYSENQGENVFKSLQ